MKRALFPLFACLLVMPAAAQRAPFADPTRPPSAIVEARNEAAPKAGPRLQSVLISPSRRVAVISGHAVAVGDRYGDATIASIFPGTVVLRYSDRRETLHLIPDVEKRDRRTGEAAARERGTSR